MEVPGFSGRKYGFYHDGVYGDSILHHECIFYVCPYPKDPLDIAGSSSRDSGRDSCKYLSGGFIVRPPECQAKSQAFSVAEQQQNSNGDIAGEEAVSPEISRKKVRNTWKSVVPSVGIGYNKTHKRQKIRAARRDQTAQGERGFRCWTIIRN